MRKWLGWTILGLFVGSILFSAISVVGQRVNVDLLFPWIRLQDVALGIVLFVFAAYGALAVVLMSLLDRSRLTIENKKLRSKTAELEREVKALRQLTAGDTNQ